MKNKVFNEMAAYVASMLVLIGLMFYFGVSARTLSDKLEVSEQRLQATVEELAATQDELNYTNEMLRIEQEETDEMAENIGRISAELDAANETIEVLSGDEYKLVYLGDFKLTHYCCEEREHICGTGTGITATGTHVTAGRTIAVDPDVIPYGTQVYIEGYGWRTAEDCGGAVNNKQIDIAVSTHDQAINMGTRSGGVWLLVKN